MSYIKQLALSMLICTIAVPLYAPLQPGKVPAGNRIRLRKDGNNRPRYVKGPGGRLVRRDEPAAPPIAPVAAAAVLQQQMAQPGAENKSPRNK